MITAKTTILALLVAIMARSQNDLGSFGPRSCDDTSTIETPAQVFPALDNTIARIFGPSTDNEVVVVNLASQIVLGTIYRVILKTRFNFMGRETEMYMGFLMYVSLPQQGMEPVIIRMMITHTVEELFGFFEIGEGDLAEVKCERDIKTAYSELYNQDADGDEDKGSDDDESAEDKRSYYQLLNSVMPHLNTAMKRYNKEQKGSKDSADGGGTDGTSASSDNANSRDVPASDEIIDGVSKSGDSNDQSQQASAANKQDTEQTTTDSRETPALPEGSTANNQDDSAPLSNRDSTRSSTSSNQDTNSNIDLLNSNA